MKITSMSKLFIICCILFTGIAVNAQDGVKSRSITSDDFAAQRPDTPRSSRRSRPSKRKRHKYNFVRADRRRATSKPTSSAVKITEIGVTGWRLRPPRAKENGQLLPVIDSNKLRQMWLAERVGIDTTFSAGDKIRFAVESSDVGYLYVFDRETHADGSLGIPYLIFPENSLDDNSVGPGMIVDIPDQRDDVPYFNINPKNPNYSGEMLTVIISPTPITNFKTDRDGKLANSEYLTELEFGTEVELYSRADTADKIFSKSESESTCGSATRRSEQSKAAGKPCGVRSRQLTRDEPLPQSIYRVKGTTGQPAVAFVKLVVR